MRALPSSLDASLASGVTTLCWCWRIARADGVVLGFTDHDRDLTFDSITYAAASAQGAGAVNAEAGFASNAGAVAGALESALITEADIARGLYEGAAVTLYRVDWSDPDSRVLFWSGTIGEISRGEHGFEGELLGRQAALERSIGRVYQRRCDAELGDGRCGVDLDQAAYRANATADVVTGARSLRATALASFADGWFAGGVLRWLTGDNTGATSEIAAHRANTADASIELHEPPPSPIAAGDTFSIDAGCDKRWATCKAKFANTVNFRGFPLTPGDDWLQAGPRSSDRNDGGSLWTDRDA
jgi:uncharacterized phage protein (TIGR02218 family)